MTSKEKRPLVSFPNQETFTRNSVDEFVMNHRYYSRLTNTSYSDIFDPESPLMKYKGAIPKKFPPELEKLEIEGVGNLAKISPTPNFLNLIYSQTPQQTLTKRNNYSCTV